MRRLKRLLVLLVVVILVAAIGIAYYSDSLVRKAMEEAGTTSLGVATTVGKVDLGWVRDSCEFNELAVANPEGFRSAEFLSVGRISVAQAVPSFLSDKIIVPYLEITDISVFLETDGSSTNFEPIIQNIQGKSGGASETESAPAASQPSSTSAASSEPSGSSEGGGRQLTIKKLVIKNLHVSCLVQTPLGEAVPVLIDIPTIELDNLRSDDTQGTLVDNVGSIVLTVLSVVQQTVQSQLPGAIARSLTASLDGLAGSIPMLGGLTEELASKAGPIKEQFEALSTGARAVQDALKKAGGSLPEEIGGLTKGKLPGTKEDAEKTVKKARKAAEGALRGLLGGGR